MSFPDAYQPEVPLKAQTSMRRAQIGVTVGRRLAKLTEAEAVDTPHAQIFLLDGFLNASDCARLIALIERECAPSRLFEAARYGGYRTSSSCNLDRGDSFVSTIEARICAALGIAPRHGETVQGQRYRTGEKFGVHPDFFYTDQPYWPQQARHGGQRTWTAMAYLNEPEEGGMTNFPHLQLSIAPRLGRLAVWNNMAADGSPSNWTLHAGEPVTKGTKYIITKWFREKPWI